MIPYLQQAPTHKQTGTTADSPNGSTDSLQKADHSQAREETINSVNDPYGPRRWRSSMVELSGKNRALNEFSVERIGEGAEQNLVILHGYGAGLGFFYKNFEPLSRVKGWQLYALDMLGMGRSTRPSFKIKSKNRQAAIKEAEDWFIDALEEWRQKRKIDRFTLLGHSLGGYMAVAYALKYPGRLNKLVLVSPVGIPEDPYAVSADMPDAGDSALANEFSQDQSTIASGEGDEDTQKIIPRGDGNNFLNARSKDSADSSGVPRRRPVPKWLTYLWDANISPFTLVRWSGPLGPRLVSGWTHRRFSHLPAAEAQALHDYSYSIFRLRGSGEYALAYILAPGAFARSPLIRRIHHVGRQLLPPSSESSTGVSTPASAGTRSTVSISASENPSVISSPEREKGIPIVFMYGDNDWMDISGGYAAKAKIEEETRRILRDATAPEERAADNGSAKVITIPNAGHHLYLDGWEEFNQAILDEMADVTRRERRRNGSMTME
jgi:cardiolipin-specific phospholipase